MAISHELAAEKYNSCVPSDMSSRAFLFNRSTDPTLQSHTPVSSRNFT